MGRINRATDRASWLIGDPPIAHGGAADVPSSGEDGTTFRLTFPLRR